MLTFPTTQSNHNNWNLQREWRDLMLRGEILSLNVGLFCLNWLSPYTFPLQQWFSTFFGVPPLSCLLDHIKKNPTFWGQMTVKFHLFPFLLAPVVGSGQGGMWWPGNNCSTTSVPNCLLLDHWRSMKDHVGVHVGATKVKQNTRNVWQPLKFNTKQQESVCGRGVGIRLCEVWEPLFYMSRLSCIYISMC